MSMHRPGFSVAFTRINTASVAQGYICQPATERAARAMVYELILGIQDTGPLPDVNLFTAIRRITDENATPGGSAIDASYDDPGYTTAKISTRIQAPTAEPTYPASVGDAVLIPAWNSRGGGRWVAAERGLVIPDAEDNGFAIFPRGTSGTAGNQTVAGLLRWLE